MGLISRHFLASGMEAAWRTLVSSAKKLAEAAIRQPLPPVSPAARFPTATNARSRLQWMIQEQRETSAAPVPPLVEKGSPIPAMVSRPSMGMDLPVPATASAHLVERETPAPPLVERGLPIPVITVVSPLPVKKEVPTPLVSPPLEREKGLTAPSPASPPRHEEKVLPIPSHVSPPLSVSQSAPLTPPSLMITPQEPTDKPEPSEKEPHPSNLRTIRGIGPAFEQKLSLHHVFTIEQLAALSPAACQELKQAIPRIHQLQLQAQQLLSKE